MIVDFYSGSILAIGLVYTLAVIGFRASIAKAFGLVDHPGSQGHKAHKAPTPLVGGLACLPPAVFALVCAPSQGPYEGDFLTLAGATAISFLVGLFDDRRHIPALQRLIICGAVFVAALIIRPEFIVSALSLESISVRVELGWLAIPFSALCLLAFQNAVNMTDGRDGLVAGITLIWLAALFSYGPHPSNFPIATLFAGLLIVFLANLRGLLFLGDAGTYGIGAFVGLTTIWIHGSGIGLYTIDVISIMLIPILDMIRLFGMRLLRGRHPFSADHDHLHHYLDQAVGWLWGRRIYFGLVAVPIILLRTGIVAGIEATFIGSVLYIAVLAFAATKSTSVKWP
jgi:UDP-GlcNAc:undecaprenyl-phosphate GlcNAc-1-phosphate transferase